MRPLYELFGKGSRKVRFTDTPDSFDQDGFDWSGFADGRCKAEDSHCWRRLLAGRSAAARRRAEIRGPSSLAPAAGAAALLAPVLARPVCPWRLAALVAALGGMRLSPGCHSLKRQGRPPPLVTPLQDFRELACERQNRGPAPALLSGARCPQTSMGYEIGTVPLGGARSCARSRAIPAKPQPYHCILVGWAYKCACYRPRK